MARRSSAAAICLQGQVRALFRYSALSWASSSFPPSFLHFSPSRSLFARLLPCPLPVSARSFPPPHPPPPLSLSFPLSQPAFPYPFPSSLLPPCCSKPLTMFDSPFPHFPFRLPSPSPPAPTSPTCRAPKAHRAPGPGGGAAYPPPPRRLRSGTAVSRRRGDLASGGGSAILLPRAWAWARRTTRRRLMARMRRSGRARARGGGFGALRSGLSRPPAPPRARPAHNRPACARCLVT